MPLKANYWFAFLCASLSVLRKGGSLCFVLPASWEYADYNSSFRKKIGEKFGTFETHRCLHPLFNVVQEGCVVIVGHDYGGRGSIENRYEHETSESLIDALRRAPVNKKKASSANGSLSARTNVKSCRLGDIIDIQIGGVTGDAHYFLLTEYQRIRTDLPLTALRQVVSKARHLQGASITKSVWQKLKDQGERVWLFQPSKSINGPNCCFDWKGETALF